MTSDLNTVIDLDDTGSTLNQNFIQSYSNVKYDSGPTDDLSSTSRSRSSQASVFPGTATSDLGQAVASQVWISSTEKAKKYASIYGNIDILRPYFDVEPRTVVVRLARAFVPISQKSRGTEFPSELYGPSMLAFTLVALLLYSMKASSHVVQEGTLIGTAMGVCFGYWFAVSALVFFTAYVFNCNFTFIQVLSLTGYSFVAPCVIVLLSTIFHPVHDHIFFYCLWLTMGGLTSSRLATAFASRTTQNGHRVTLMGISVTCNMLFMLYLHFAYHSTVAQLQQSIAQ